MHAWYSSTVILVEAVIYLNAITSKQTTVFLQSGKYATLGIGKIQDVLSYSQIVGFAYLLRIHSTLLLVVNTPGDRDHCQMSA